MKSVYIKLRGEDEIEVYEEFKDAVKENASDVSKMTKKFWRDYVEASKGEENGQRS